MLDRFIDSLADWDAWTAIGTLALAAATFYLSMKTRALARDAGSEIEAVRRQSEAVVGQAEASRQQADATETLARKTSEQAELSAQALELQVRPYLIPDVPVRIGSELAWTPGVEREQRQTLEVPITNAGNGPALVRSARASDTHARAFATRPPAAIAPGRTGTLTLMPPDGGGLPLDETVAVSVAYQGVEMATKELGFTLTRVAGGGWTPALKRDW
jgi:hypothetical protein